MCHTGRDRSSLFFCGAASRAWMRVKGSFKVWGAQSVSTAFDTERQVVGSGRRPRGRDAGGRAPRCTAAGPCATRERPSSRAPSPPCPGQAGLPASPATGACPPVHFRGGLTPSASVPEQRDRGSVAGLAPVLPPPSRKCPLGRDRATTWGDLPKGCSSGQKLGNPRAFWRTDLWLEPGCGPGRWDRARALGEGVISGPGSRLRWGSDPDVSQAVLPLEPTVPLLQGLVGGGWGPEALSKAPAGGHVPSAIPCCLHMQPRSLLRPAAASCLPTASR